MPMTGALPSESKPRSILPATWAKSSLIVLLLLASAARWFWLDSQSLWLDELLQLILVQADLSSLPERLASNAAAPMDYLLSLGLLILGRQEFWLRFPASLFSLATLPLMFQLGRRLWGMRLGEPSGVVAVALAAIAPLAVHYAQEVRPYAAFGFWSLLATYVLYRAIRRDDSRFWLVYAMVMAINLHTHLFALAVLVAHGMWLAVLALGSLIQRPRPLVQEAWAWRWSWKRHAWALGIMILLLALALFSPWLPHYIASVISRFLTEFVPVSSPSVITGGDLVPQAGGVQRIDRSLLVGALQALGAGETVPVNWLYLVLATVGLFAGLKRRPAATLLQLLLLLAAPLLIIALLASRQARFNPRYIIFAQPAYLLLIGYGVAVLADTAYQRLRTSQGGPAVGLGIALLTLVLLFAATLPGLRYYYAITRDDWRGMAHVLSQLVQDGDTVATWRSLDNYLRFYWPEVESHVQRLETPEDLADLSGDAIWLVQTPYDRLGDLAPLRQWLRGHQVVALNFTSRFWLYFVDPGDNSLATLEKRAIDLPLGDDPEWRKRLAQAYEEQASVLEAAGDVAAAAQLRARAAAHLEALQAGDNP